jgi:hypothetical protein
LLEALERRELLATFYVQNTLDYAETDSAVVGSLRYCLEQANQSPEPDNIFFAIPASNVPDLSVPVAGFNALQQKWTIALVRPLPGITSPLVIDGYTQAHSGVPFRYPAQLSTVPLGDPVVITSTPNTQPALNGNDARVRVVIDGANAGSDAIGIDIRSPSCEVRGLAIGGFDVGIAINDVGARVQGNFIGWHVVYRVDAETGDQLPPTIGIGLGGPVNRAQGVRISATNAALGGVVPQENNVISGNGLEGVWVQQGAVGNLITGNQIGVIGPTPAGRYFQLGNGVLGAASHQASGILIEASGNTVGGAVAGAGNIVSANVHDGIWIRGTLAARTVVSGNYVGAAPGGDFVFGAGDPGNGGDGIRIENAPLTRVGGAQGTQRNIISSNAAAGVHILGSAAIGTDVVNNFIGLLAGGNSVLGNRAEGVLIDLGATGARIGPTNVISGNRVGIVVSGNDTSGHVIIDNFIGTDATGQSDLGNALEGIRIESGSHDNQILGNGQGSQVISGNNVGVALQGQSVTRNTLRGTYIGTNSSGDRDLGNSLQGVWIDNSPANIIGGAASTLGNLISGNLLGLEISGDSASGNQVLGNRIGTDRTGDARIGNTLEGIWIHSGANLNSIGGSVSGAGNRIGFNGRDGVRVEGNSTGNNLLGSTFIQNRLLGINLVAPGDPASGVTPNDTGDGDTGPNQLQNAPTLTNVLSLRSATRIDGQLESAPGATLLVQFFSSATLSGSGSGEGETFLGQITVTTDPTGLALFQAVVPVLVSGGFGVTATATDGVGNTSEFSNGVVEAQGTVRFLRSTYSVGENSGSASVELVREGGSGGYFTVDYQVREGTALLGLDFQIETSSNDPQTTGTVVFGPGETSRSFSVIILDDSFQEGDETVLLSLKNSRGPVKIGEPSAATLSILDDDQPGEVRFETANYSVTEGQGSLQIRLIRDGKAGPVSVELRSTSGSAQAGLDFAGVSRVVTFAANQTEAIVVINILNDDLVESSESFTVTLSNPTAGLGIGSLGSTVVTIEDDDSPGQVEFVSSEFEVYEDAGMATIRVRRTGTGGLVMVSYELIGISATPTTDFDARGGTLVFLPGETEKIIQVPIIADLLSEPDETFVISLRNPTNGLSLGAPTSTLVTIRNVVQPTPPVVTSLVANPIAGTRGSSGITIGFSEAIDPARAVDLRNYGFSVRLPGRDRKLGTRDDILVGLASASYDPNAHTVTLNTVRPIAAGTSVLVTIHAAVNEPGSGVGIRDLEGTPLDGDRDGRAGGTFVRTIVVPKVKASRLSARPKSRVR